MTAGDLHDRLAAIGGDLMHRALGALERGSLQVVPQPDDGVTYAEKIEQERDPDRLGQARAATCTTISAGCRRFRARGSRCRTTRRRCA